MHLPANKLYSRGVLNTKSISELLGMIVCDTKKRACMDRTFANCCFETESITQVTSEQWKRVTSTNGEKTFSNVAKQTQTRTIKDFMELFHQKLEALAVHQFNWLHQAEQFHLLKQNVRVWNCSAHRIFWKLCLQAKHRDPFLSLRRQ